MKATPEEIAKTDRLIKPQEPPERIYGWMNTQLSIARHYGGLTYQGHHYVIAQDEDDHPLVRADVIKRELKAKADQAKADRKAQKLAAKQAQEALL